MVDDIFGFEIAVDDLALVHVVEGFECVFEDDFCQVLVQFALFAQKAI
jgi:hypothetical protein